VKNLWPIKHHVHGIDFEQIDTKVFLVVHEGNQLELGDLDQIYKTREQAEMVADKRNKFYSLSGDDKLVVRQMSVRLPDNFGLLYRATVAKQ